LNKSNWEEMNESKVRKTIIWSLVSLLLTWTTIESIAQEVSQVAPGDRVRVSLIETVFVSRLVALNADTVFLENQLVLPIASIVKFEVNRGRKSMARKGMGTGFLIGAGIGAVVGAVTLASVCDANAGGCAGVGVLLVGLPSGLLGAVIGGTVGATNSRETWEEVPLEKVQMSWSIVKDR
jgi:hypothetical protein